MDHRPWLVSTVASILQSAPEEVCGTKDDLIDWVVNGLLEYADFEDDESSDEASDETSARPTKRGRWEDSFGPGAAMFGQPQRTGK